jgi:hypothetical protein
MGDGFDEMTEHLQSLEHELSTSVLNGGSGFCGVTAQEYAIGGTTHYWRKGSKLKIALDFDDLGVLRANQVREIIEAQVNQVRAVTDGLSFELFTPSLSANLVCKLARLDGPSGVLADCGIPMPNASPDNTQLQMRIDTGEAWRHFTSERVNGAIDFGRTWLHEFLHFLGLGHKPTSISDPAIIAPSYNPLLWLLQQADKGEIVRRYGGRTTPIVPVPPIPPVTPATEIRGEMKVTINGEPYGASGILKKLPQSFVFPPIEMREDFHDEDETEILPE